MFRKPVKKRTHVQSRQRLDEEVHEDEGDCGVIKDIKRRKRANPFQQSTMKSSKAIATEEATSSDDSESGHGTIVDDDSFAASGSAAPLGPSDQGATATLEINTDYDRDAQAQFERVQQQLKEGLVKDGKTLYKGHAMYGAKEAKDSVKGNASSGLNRIGPIRAPQFLRQTVRWDYAPDICKDYKETGFCTFGDSCKFLHDRSDYKHGWEIERDYASGRLHKVDDTNYEINDGEDEFPEDCFICGKPFVSPVVTRCKHYFCETCALNSFRKSKRCQVCGQNTGGVFNIAKDLIAKLTGTVKKRKERDSDSDSSGEGEASCSHHQHAAKQEKYEESRQLDTVKQEIVEDDIVTEEQAAQSGDDQKKDENEIDEGESHKEEEQEETEIKMEEVEQDDSEALEDEGSSDSDREEVAS